MKTFDQQMKFLDATEQTKGILDLIEAVGDSGQPLYDGSLWRAAQAARELVEKAEGYYYELELAHRKATRGELSGSRDGHLEACEQIPAPAGEWWEDIKTNACQCLGDAYSLGYDAGRKANNTD